MLLIFRFDWIEIELVTDAVEPCKARPAVINFDWTHERIIRQANPIELGVYGLS